MITNVHPNMIAYTDEPMNAGTPLDGLCQSPVTPAAQFFVRNHGDVPVIDPAAYRLIVDGLVRRELRLSLDELRQFPRHTVVATLQCAGFRRLELHELRPIENEILWATDAIGTAEWSGVRLRDVLEAAGARETARHAVFTGLDRIDRDGEVSGFGSSITLEQALSDDVLLADTMNGEPLPALHGFPLRVVVPGTIGARSVKWLARVTVADRPSDNYYQQRAYKLFPPDVDEAGADWSRGEMLYDLPVNAFLCHPRDGQTLRAGEHTVTGYALTGWKREIERVEVSGDGGQTWQQATLEAALAPAGCAWRRWHARLALAEGTATLVVRAWDSDGRTQPDDAAQIWNFKGYLNNAVHRVTVRVESAGGG